MNLRINRVVDFGTHASERIELAVTGNCNLHSFIIADTTYIEETSISNKLRHMHWFSTRDVIAGDEIFLYTKSGTTSTEAINGGRNTRYILYWGLGSYVWNNNGDAAVLFNINTWQTTKVV